MVTAESPNPSQEEVNIKTTIETFFNDYEVAVDNEDADFQDIDKTFDGDLVNKTLIKTILSRKVTLAMNYPNGTLKELNKKLEFNYVSIDINGEKAEVQVSVTKRFNYNITPKVTSGERNNYIIKLKKDNYWKIQYVNGFIDNSIQRDFDGKNINSESIENLNTYNANLKQDVKTFYTKMAEELSVLRNAKGVVLSEYNNVISPMATTYNRSGAVQYAVNHADTGTYNRNYFNFGDSGGDCTNFISQCLHEGGGISEHVGTAYSDTCWYYTTSTNRSSSWTGATQFNRYIKSSVSKINKTMVTFDTIDKGDIIQLGETSSPYHSLIVTGIAMGGANYRTDLLICCHTTDRLNESLLATFGGENMQYIHILGGK